MNPSLRQFCWVIILAILSGCQRREKQHTAEAQVAGGIVRMMEWQDVLQPGVRVTNLSQVLAAAEQGYPHVWDRRFRTFGKHAGFTNSIFEKYIFFPAGFSNKWLGSEILFMNARPYPGPYGDMQRSVVSKVAETYHRQSLDEKQVQQLFGELGIPEPKPVRMPAPPPPPEKRDSEPLFRKIQGRFLDFTTANGFSNTTTVILWYGLVTSPFVVLGLMVIQMWRRSAR